MSSIQALIHTTAMKAMHIGAERERERIIKLLQDYLAIYYQLSPNADAVKYPIEATIALIKGETE